MDVQSAARALNLTQQSVRRAAREGRLESRGEGRGREFLVVREEPAQQALLVEAQTPSWKPQRFESADGTYHSEVDTVRRVVVAYIPFLKKPLRVPFDLDSWLHLAYSSDGENMTVKEMARKFGVNPKVMRGYLRARGLEHASLPIPDHEMAELTDDDLFQSLDAVRAAKAQARVDAKIVQDLKRKASIAEDLETWYQEAAEALAEPLQLVVVRKATARQVRRDEPVSWIVPESDTHIDAMGNDGQGYEYQREQVRKARAVLIDRAQALGPVKAWYKWVGSDLANSDNKQGKTTSTRNQQYDSLPSGKRVRALVEAEFEALETYLATGAPLVLSKVKGNHDWMFSDWLFEVVRARYEDHPKVSFIEDIEGRCYVRVGSALCIFAHGHIGRLTEATLREMAVVEAPHLLAGATRVHVLRGDKHTRRQIDSNGGSGQDVGVAAMSPQSQWSAEMGFISGRRLHALGITEDGEMPFDITATAEAY